MGPAIECQDFGSHDESGKCDQWTTPPLNPMASRLGCPSLLATSQRRLASWCCACGPLAMRAHSLPRTGVVIVAWLFQGRGEPLDFAKPPHCHCKIWASLGTPQQASWFCSCLMMCRLASLTTGCTSCPQKDARLLLPALSNNRLDICCPHQQC